jgi:hypothetical protein
MSSAIGNARKGLLAKLSSTFASIGWISENFPILTIVFAVFATLLAGTGIPSLELETDSFELWVPQTLVAYNNYQFYSENFKGADRNFVLMLQDVDGGSVLTRDIMAEAISIHVDITENIRGEEEGIKFKTVCDRVEIDTDCRVDNILAVFNYDLDYLNSLTDEQIIDAVEGFATLVPLDTSLGGIEYDESNPPELESAKVLRLVYSMTSVNTTDPLRGSLLDEVMDLETTLMNTFDIDWNAPDSGQKTSINMITERSIDDEITRLIVSQKASSKTVFVVFLSPSAL